MELKRITPEPAFAPVQITLQTQREVDWLYNLMQFAQTPVVKQRYGFDETSVYESIKHAASKEALRRGTAEFRELFSGGLLVGIQGT